MSTKYRYEIIDRMDMVVAVAEIKSDARYAAQKHNGYIFDTLIRRVVK